MPEAKSRRLYWKLFSLSLLFACLVFVTAGPGASADGNCCIDQFNSCNAQCPPICDASGCISDFPCELNCNEQYSQCSAPGGGGGCYIPPEEPCPGCAEGCDVMQQECVNSGGDPRSCVAAGVRCRRSCNVGCPQ